MTDKIIVLVTCGSAGEAARIARWLVERRVAACVNILQSPVRSVYRWKNKIETARERLLVIKTSRPKFSQLCAHVKRLHSYAVPEIIALPIVEGAASYLRWIEECLRPGRMKKKRKERRA